MPLLLLLPRGRKLNGAFPSFVVLDSLRMIRLCAVCYVLCWFCLFVGTEQNRIAPHPRRMVRAGRTARACACLRRKTGELTRGSASPGISSEVSYFTSMRMLRDARRGRGSHAVAMSDLTFSNTDASSRSCSNAVSEKSSRHVAPSAFVVDSLGSPHTFLYKKYPIVAPLSQTFRYLSSTRSSRSSR